MAVRQCQPRSNARKASVKSVVSRAVSVPLTAAAAMIPLMLSSIGVIRLAARSEWKREARMNEGAVEGTPMARTNSVIGR